MSSRQWLPFFVSVAPLFMWSVIRVQVVASFEYCGEALTHENVTICFIDF